MKQFVAGFVITLVILIFMDMDDVIEIVKDNTATA